MVKLEFYFNRMDKAFTRAMVMVMVAVVVVMMMTTMPTEMTVTSMTKNAPFSLSFRMAFSVCTLMNSRYRK